MALLRGSTNKQITDEAAQWYVEWSTGEPDPDARAAFDTWLRRSPEHLRAYLDIFKIWESIPDIPAASLGSEAELIARSALESSVVRLREGDRRDAPDPPDAAMGPAITGSLQRGRFPWLACAAGVAALCGGLAIWLLLRASVYSTGIGEQRILRLADGSEVELNARSKIRVSLDKSGRTIELLSGEALFRVERDERRPFIVAARDMKVLALGTQFDVHLKRTGATVTVVDGRVAVAPAAIAPGVTVASGVGVAPGAPAAPPAVDGSPALAAPSGTPARQPPASRAPQRAPIQLGAGQQLTVSASGEMRAERVDVASAMAWREHRLVFSSTPLAEVVDEFNRYNERQLVIVSSVLETLHVNAIFSATDVPALLRFLREQREIQIEESDREIRISNAVR